ncbi:MAG: LCP family protein [Ruminococcus sp.]|nr:LCP family protein [Ruminococcus sp.]
MSRTLGGSEGSLETGGEDLNLKIAEAIRKKKEGSASDRLGSLSFSSTAASGGSYSSYSASKNKRASSRMIREQKEEKKKKGRWASWSIKKRIGVILGFLFLLVVIVFAFLIFVFHFYTGLLNRNDDNRINMDSAPFDESNRVDGDDTFDEEEREKELIEQLSRNASTISDKDVMNILLIGEDIRDTATNDRGNTDVMMIISINKAQKTITMTSLMRDMWVYMPEYNQSGKLNSAYWHGGAKYLKQVIEDYFNIEIDRFVRINFEQFIDVVEAVGGLDLEVCYSEAYAMQAPLDEQNHYLGYKHGTDYLDLDQFEYSEYDVENRANYKKVHLNGNQALAYARVRYGVGDDYGRTMRQRIVISECIKEGKKLRLLQLDKLLKKILPEIQTDITDEEIASLLLSAFDYMKYDIQELRIPVDGYYYNDIRANQAVLSPDYLVNSVVMEYVIYGDQTNAEDALQQYYQEMNDGTFWDKYNKNHGIE